jgi:hypothetical protein
LKRGSEKGAFRPRQKKVPELQNKGSLITFADGDRECCLNYLFHTPQHGVFDPNFGNVDVTPEEAELHNAALDEALAVAHSLHDIAGRRRNVERVVYNSTVIFFFTADGGVFGAAEVAGSATFSLVSRFFAA